MLSSNPSLQNVPASSACAYCAFCVLEAVPSSGDARRSEMWSLPTHGETRRNSVVLILYGSAGRSFNK